MNEASISIKQLLKELSNGKPTILVCTDSARVHSGLANSTRELFTRIHAMDKYNIVQHGWAGIIPVENVPWRVILTETEQRPDGRIGIKPEDQHGAVSLPKILAQGLKPDIVFGYGDPWMLQGVSFNDFRKGYKLINYITVDGEPAHTKHADVFQAADRLIVPTEYGRHVLQAAGLPVHGVVPLGVDVTTYKKYPVEARAELKSRVCKKKLGDVIIGLVGRNQPRKKIPEAIKALYYIRSGNYVTCIHCERVTIAPFDHATKTPGPKPGACKWCLSKDVTPAEPKKNVYMYLQTVLGETRLGWDLAAIIKEYFTDPYPLYHNLGLEPAAGLRTKELVDLYNIFDIFTLPTNGEGWGLPILEAMACEVPVVTTDAPAHNEYCAEGSLLTDCIRYREPLTIIERFHIVIEDYIKNLVELVDDSSRRAWLGKRGRNAALKYSWDLVAKQWCEVFDDLLEDKLRPWQVLLEV